MIPRPHFCASHNPSIVLCGARVALPLCPCRFRRLSVLISASSGGVRSFYRGLTWAALETYSGGVLVLGQATAHALLAHWGSGAAVQCLAGAVTSVPASTASLRPRHFFEFLSQTEVGSGGGSEKDCVCHWFCPCGRLANDFADSCAVAGAVGSDASERARCKEEGGLAPGLGRHTFASQTAPCPQEACRHQTLPLWFRKWVEEWTGGSAWTGWRGSAWYSWRTCGRIRLLC